MNNKLLEQIVKHIFVNLRIIPSDYISDKSKSLISKDYILDKNITFNIDNESVIKSKIWGCQLMIDKGELKILLTDCSQENDLEYYLIVHLKDAPAYGLYLGIDKDQNADYTIVCSVDYKNWMKCSTYLQATFLAGMEQLKDLKFVWNKCQNYNEQYEMLCSFIKYYDSCEEFVEEK